MAKGETLLEVVEIVYVMENSKIHFMPIYGYKNHSIFRLSEKILYHLKPTLVYAQTF